MRYVRRRTDARYRWMVQLMHTRISGLGLSFDDRGRSLIESNIFEPGTDMKCILILSILALLGSCAIVPARYGDHRDGYYRERDYNRGDSNYRERYYNQDDRNYRDYGDRRG